MIVLFFDDFKDSQNVNYLLLRNSILKDKISHAYLVDANHNEHAFDFVLSFIKMILCNDHYSNNRYEKCKKCNLCDRIQNGNYPEIKVIEPASNVIKKEQLLELQSEFSMSSIEGKYRIYIIKDCDKMNQHASNSLLKFLEEPHEGIIAILLTNHFSTMLSTIVSRCQIIHLTHSIVLENKSSLENFIVTVSDSDDAYHEMFDKYSESNLLSNVFDFIGYFEDNGLDILLFMKKMWYNKFQTRDDSLLAFQIMIYFYYDVLKYKLGYSSFLFCDDIVFIEKISNMNSVDGIVKKLEIIQYGYDMILCNLNVNLLLDDVMIRLGEVK